MFQWLSIWLGRMRSHRLALATARRHFEATTGQKSHRGGSVVLGKHDGGLVVRVCYGDIKPKRRAWYLIGSDGIVVRPVTFGEAELLGEQW